jgi:SAM-dependent methyltransferase
MLPVADGVFDGAYCTGSPQIAGGEACLREMHRALRPGGWLAVSDWVWRARPVPPEVVPPHVKVEQFMLIEEYAGWLRDAGFEPVLARVLPDFVWHDYYGPMLEHYADVRRRFPDDPEAQGWADVGYANEPRFWYETEAPRWWAYAAFIARKVTKP